MGGVVRFNSPFAKENTLTNLAVKYDLETKSDNDNVESVRAAIAALTGEVEKKSASFEELSERLAKLEAKSNRPAGAANDNEPDAEKKAFDDFLRKGILPAEQKALSVGTDTAGGFTVPEQFVNELLRNVTLFSPIRNYARVMQIASAEAKLPKRSGTLTAAWVSETGARSASEPTYGQVTLTPYEAAVYTDVSTQLIEDSAFNIESELAFDFGEEFGRLEGAAFVSGDGVGKPSGITTNADIAQINSGNAATFTGDSLIDLFYSLKAPYRTNAVFGMAAGSLAVARKLKTTDGVYVWQPSLAAGQPETILGRPVIEIPDMPAVAAGALPIFFGDLSQGYRIADRISLSVLRDPYSQATNGLTRFHARRRVGGGVVKAEAIKLMKIAA